MTKKLAFYTCTVCGSQHNRGPRQAKFCSERCQLLSHVAKGEREDPGACWNWQSSTDAAGYGQLSLNGKHGKAHRLSFSAHHGAVPGGMGVCHRCDNPACINPDHLFAGTNRENILDCKAKGRLALGEDHGRAILSEVDALAIRSANEAPNVLAERFGVSTATIFDIWSSRSWSHLPPRTELCPLADPSGHSPPKLNFETAERIRREHRPGERGFGDRALAKLYGVSRQTIRSILAGKSYSRGFYVQGGRGR